MLPRVLSGGSAASTAASTIESLAVAGKPATGYYAVTVAGQPATGYSPRAEGKDVASSIPGLRVASLGSYCGVRQSIKKAGKDAASLPFDWMRTRVEGILHFLRNDFDGFFDFVTTQVVPGSGGYGIPPMVMYRDWRHSFWHDDPTDLKEQEKYRRRFQRFKDLETECGEPENTLLFVRSVHCFEELQLTDELLQELMKRFGPTVKLLLIVPSQQNLSGPVLIDGRENLLVYCLETKAFAGTDAPFVAAVDCAVEWALGKAIQAKAIPHMNDLMAMAARWYPCTMGGLEAFEPLPTREQPAQQPLTHRGSSSVPSAVLKPRCLVPHIMMPPPVAQPHVMPLPTTFSGFPNSSRAPSVPRGSLASAPMQPLRCIAATPRAAVMPATAHTSSAPTNPYHGQHAAMRCFEQACVPPGARTPAAPPVLRPPVPQRQRHPSAMPQRPQPSLC